MYKGTFLDRAMTRIIPSRLREELRDGSPEFLQVRALAVMLVISTLVSVLSSCTWLIVALMERGRLVDNALLVVTLAVTLLLLIETVLYYTLQNFRISATFMILSYFVLAVILVVISGGYHSEIKMLLVTSPMIAFVIGGRQEGLVNTVFVFLIGIGLIVMDQAYIELINMFEDQNQYLVSGVCWSVTLMVVVTTLLVYDVELEHVTNQGS
jgi:hypothetical protein